LGAPRTTVLDVPEAVGVIVDHHAQWASERRFRRIWTSVGVFECDSAIISLSESGAGVASEQDSANACSSGSTPGSREVLIR
jgi:hypothetical protein